MTARRSGSDGNSGGNSTGIGIGGDSGRDAGRDADAPAEPEVTELTGAVVIGCGLSGLAVARELSRQGVDSIVIHGPVQDADSIREASGEPGVFTGRVELVRLLQAYAASHHLDIRENSEAREITPAAPGGLLPAAVPGKGKWAVRTGRELLLADYVVLTSCSRADLRKLARAMGAGSVPMAAAALRDMGMYLVGVGLLPTLGSLIRQARAAGAAIADAAPPAVPCPG